MLASWLVGVVGARLYLGGEVFDVSNVVLGHNDRTEFDRIEPFAVWSDFSDAVVEIETVYINTSGYHKL